MKLRQLSNTGFFSPYFKSIVKRRTAVTSAIKLDCDALDSVTEWIVSNHQKDSTSPLPVTTRFKFKLSSPKDNPALLSVSTSSKSAKPLTKEQSFATIAKLLSPLVIEEPERESEGKAPLSSSNLLRSLPYPLPPVAIEYSSPNIAKPLHMGHLRSTITGSYVRNIAEFAGHYTKSICFLGDWGRQFGVLHAGVEDALKSKSQENADFETFINSLDLNELLKIYVDSSNIIDSNEDFRTRALKHSAELEDSFNKQSVHSKGYHLWRYTSDKTVEHLKSCYKALNISFDEFQRESEYNRESNHTVKALESLESKGITEYREDKTLRLKELKNYNVLLKSDNSSVYLLRDIACALKRKNDDRNRNFVYVVDSGQSDHFKTVFWALDKLELSIEQNDTHQVQDTHMILPFKNDFSHVPFNRVIGMSSRSGNAVLLSDVISEGTKIMHENRLKSKNARNTEDISVSEQLAVSGLIINSLKFKRLKAYEFVWDEALRSSGNTGVSLQYTVARIRSLLQRVKEEIGMDGGIGFEVECRVDTLLEFGNLEVIELLVCLMNFEDTFWKSYVQLEPCVLVQYCFTLSDKISRVLSSVRVINHPDKQVSMSVAWSLGMGENVLHTCMRILGLKVIQGGF